MKKVTIIKKEFVILIFLILALLLYSPSVEAPCCGDGCYPEANCCIDDDSNPLDGKGSVGCKIKDAPSVCPERDSRYLAEANCGTCECTTLESCRWQTVSSACLPNEFCKINYDAPPEEDTAVSSECLQACSQGQTLCADNVCRTPPCQNPPVCDGICGNGNADSCSCSECAGERASCQDGYVCDSITKACVSLPPCPEGTTLCADGYCRSDCSVDGGNAPCNSDGTCQNTEGCTCSDCDGEESPCQSGLFCADGQCTQNPSVTCPSCSDCSSAGSEGETACSLTECHECDLRKCYFSSGNCNDCDATNTCSTYNNDPQACNGLINGCEKNCYYTALNICNTCAGTIFKCEDYNAQDTCTANPCNTGTGNPNSCIWFINACRPAPTGNPDDTAQNCEIFDSTKIQGICNEIAETNCWDEKANGASPQMNCCGDDGSSDDWKNADGSGCVDGKYYPDPNLNKNLCGTGAECTDKNLNCWAENVNELIEASDLTKCCQPNEQWFYITTEKLSDILVLASCANTEWYDSSRVNSVTYYQIKRRI